VTDFAWWDKQKQERNFMISVLKENSTATFVESIHFDQDHKVNTGIESYSVYQNKKAKFHVVVYRDPETGRLHQFISTLPKSMNPGTIAMLYYKRWTIEKAFNNSKSDLTERKAWSSNLNALNSQMHFTAMAYNIMRTLKRYQKQRIQTAFTHPIKNTMKRLKKDKQLPETLLRIPAPVTYRSS
jgi:IS4 transposase